MSHWRNLMKDNKYLGSWDLEVNGKYEPRIVTIEKVFQDVMVGEMGKEDKVFIKLKEFPKSMVANRSNFKRLETFFGSFNPDDYIGKQIVLSVEKVKSPQGMVDALRFSTRPLPKQEKPTLDDARFAKALQALQEGKTTVEKLTSDFNLNQAQHAEIKGIQ
jgi:hypothetical protein